MRFDILLPYYGDVSLMQAAVRSVQRQSHSDWRLVVVDDGSEPGVPEWFAGLGDERVFYQRNPVNLGVTRNYAKCLDLAEAEYLVMMGTDDIMLPDYLARVGHVIERFPGVAIIQPGVEIIDGAGTVTDTLADKVKRRLYAPRVDAPTLMGGEELATSLLRGCWFYFPSLCWRTDAVRKATLRSDLRVIQDLALVIDLIVLGEQMAVDREVVFQYRRHNVSVSAADALRGTRFTEARAYFAEAAARMTDLGWRRAARAAKRYLSSRMHAATLLPAAVRARDGAALRSLLRHAVGPAPRPDERSER